MREHVDGAIRPTAPAMFEFPFLETSHKDASQFIDLTNDFFQHSPDALVSKMTNRRDASDLVTIARPPNAGV